jgi:ferritin-like metal-binding protein YciE
LAKIARTLGHQDIAQLLETTLAEEKKANETLGNFDEKKANQSAITK